MELSTPTIQRPWTTGELALLRENACLGARAAAQVLGRSVASVKEAAHRHRISLRRPGCRRGLVLGQPRGIPLRREIREDMVSGRVDPEAIAERMRMDAEAELCPSCVRRPVRVRITGLCRVCHTGLLTEGHRERIDELNAHREHNRVKQQAKRLRDHVAVESLALAAGGDE